MTGSDDGEQPSSSPQRAAHDWYITAHTQDLSVQTSSVPAGSFSPCAQIMPSPERNAYSNIQSTKVNAGLDFGTTHEPEDGVEANTKPPVLNNNALLLNIDFGQFHTPTQTSSAAPPTAEQLIQALLHPPSHAFVHSVLSIQWVMGTLGQSHFRYRDSDERYVLSSSSSVRTQGARLGLPVVYWEWLCGDQEEASPTEQGMLLTREFFEYTRQDG